jgi:NOL1/NOP2/sun family putative RNA methylase
MAKRLFLERYSRLGHNLKGDERSRQALRVNTLKTTNEELVARLESHGARLSRIGWLRNGFHVDERPFSLGASFEYLLGLYSIQEAAAQFPVEVLDPHPGEAVLDVCAAPGGKTTQIAAAMANIGAVVAVDVSRERLYALENNLERCGVTNCLAYWEDANAMDFKGKQFDRVLLDAPCSGNYVADRGWFSKRTLKDVGLNAERQRELLGTAVKLLKPGGVLVYTTCSLEPEEDELNVQWLIDNNDLKLEGIEGPGSPALTEIFGDELNGEIAGCRRFWPDETGTQGFFVAKAVKA